MAISVTCSTCKAALRVGDAAEGKAIRCPKCGGRVAVPASRRTDERVSANPISGQKATAPKSRPAGGSAKPRRWLSGCGIFVSIVAGLFLAMFLGCAGVTYALYGPDRRNIPSSPATAGEAPNAHLSVKRNAVVTGSPIAYGIFINDRKVGVVANNSSQVIHIFVGPGDNHIRLMHEPGWFVSARESESITFRLKAKETLQVVCQAEGDGIAILEAESPPDPATFASLMVERKTAVLNSGYEYAVYVNEKKLGLVKNAETRTFRFSAREGDNHLLIKQGDSIVSAPVAFRVKPGETHKVVCQSGGWSAIDILDSGQASSNPNIVDTQADTSGLNSGVEKLVIKIDKETVVEVKSEIVNVAVGSKQTLKRTYTIEHEVNLTVSAELEVALKKNFLLFSGEIRAKLGSTLGQTFKKSETIERSVELDGDKNQRYRLVWSETVVHGTASFIENGTPRTVPFQFKKSATLDTYAAK